MKKQKAHGALVALLAAWAAGLSGASAAAQIQSAQNALHPAGLGARSLEFWPQQFRSDRFLLRVITQPLLFDKRLKQFKGLYFQKLGEGMDMHEVDLAMEAAFARYNRTRNRSRLIRDLRAIEAALRAYKPPPYTEGQFVYAAMGASISQGGGASPASRGWVYLIQDRLRAFIPGARVRNLAVGGTTTQHALEVQLPEALQCRPDLITYTSGMNDLQYGVPVEKVRENVEFTLRELRARAGAAIVITLMPPGRRFPAFSLRLPNIEKRRRNVGPERTARFNAVFRQLAARYGAQLVDIGRMFDGLSSQSEINRLFSFDGIHPNNAGHTRIAEIFWPAIWRAMASQAPQERQAR